MTDEALKKKLTAAAKIAERENREADVAEFVNRKYMPKPGRFTTYEELLTSDLAFLLNLVAELRSQLHQGEADRERMDAIAECLVESAGTTLNGMIELTFAVNPPDGGSVGVGIGLSPTIDGSSAADALRLLCDSLRDQQRAALSPAKETAT